MLLIGHLVRDERRRDEVKTRENTSATFLGGAIRPAEDALLLRGGSFFRPPQQQLQERFMRRQQRKIEICFLKCCGPFRLVSPSLSE